MKIENREVYITDDGMEFYNRIDAQEHENILLSEPIIERGVDVDKYEIIRVENKEELELLINRHEEDVFNCIGPNINFPIKVAVSFNDYNYYYVYETLESVIEKTYQILTSLKNELIQ